MTHDLKRLDAATLKPIFGPADESHLLNADVKLDADRRHAGRQTARRMKTVRAIGEAVATIGTLPASDESVHLVLRGSYALFDLLVAILEIGDEPADEVIVATLGFSASNVSRLGEMIDAGQIRSVSIACSTYFAAADKPIFDAAVDLCSKHGFKIAALRNHAKLLLVRFADRWITTESSSNLRSSRNAETATIFGSRDLYDFHRSWVLEMLAKGGA